MQLYRRPKKPETFDSYVKSSVADIDAIIKSGKIPLSKDFKNKWGKYKPSFIKAQHGKCGYCESLIVAGQYGDVEHYYPKSEITKLKTAGIEQPYSSKVLKRTFDIESVEGYWWLAYEWKNYLYSCQVCNQTWKKTLFPVSNRQKPFSKSSYHKENPLLLNPFGRKKPVDHLEFGEFGAINAKNNSRYGRATIKVCGLDRPSLTLTRKNIAEAIYRLIREIHQQTAAKDIIHMIETCKKIHHFGKEEAAFSGMVRIIFEDMIEMKWKDLENIVRKYS